MSRPAKIRFLSGAGYHAPDPAPWVYIGKDPQKRAAIAAKRGRVPKFLGTGIHRSADAVRGEVLDLLSSVGSGLDPVEWWAESAAYKAWTLSD